MKKSFKSNDEYFAFLNKSKNKIDVINVIISSTKIILEYERINKNENKKKDIRYSNK